MCSILGVFDLRPGADLHPLRPLALSLSARQRHRGPDWSGVHVEARALLVHERLAIVDPAGGAQPIHSADGALALAVNGEIYNHRELERNGVASGFGNDEIGEFHGVTVDFALVKNDCAHHVWNIRAPGQRIHHVVHQLQGCLGVPTDSGMRRF